VPRPADLLSLLRLAVAGVFPFALLRGGGVPAVLWVVAATSDYLDGPLARWAGVATWRGAVLDNVADIAFVLGGLTTAAALGLVPWIVPEAILLAVVDYARASFETKSHDPAGSLARSRTGHAAGVINYACLGMVCVGVAWPDGVPVMAPPIVELVTVATNVGAVVIRILRRVSWTGRSRAC
jgi:phosphatidylglycerophosphate synthase